MGEDWIRRTEKTWKVSVRKKVERYLAGPSLLEAGEEGVVIYTVHLLDPACSVTIGTRVVLFQRTPRAIVAVLWENQVIGSIDGDAARDLQNMFDSEPGLCRTLKAEIPGIDRTSGQAELSVAER